MICPICHHAALDRVYTNRVFSRDITVLRCDKCKAYTLFPPPETHELDEYYRHQYSTLDYRHPSAGPKTTMKLFYADMRAVSQFRFIKQRIPDLTGKNVVDFGCSTGNLLKRFKDEGCKTLGVELGRRSADFATERYDLRILRTPIEDALPIIEPPLDLVIFSHSLEHLPDPIGSLSRCFDLLRSGGHLFIELPNSYTGPPSGPKWDEFCDILLDSDHIFNFSHNNIDCLLSRCRFRVVEKKVFLSHRMSPLLKRIRLNGSVDHILKKKKEKFKRYAGIIMNTIYLIYLYRRKQETVEFTGPGRSWTGTDEWMRVLAVK